MAEYRFLDEWFVPAPSVVNKPFVRYFTPVLRPLFASKHYWTMRRGQEHILERIAS